MDDFYYNKDTIVLLNAEPFIIGNESLKQARLLTKVTKDIKVGKLVSKRVFGIPIIYGDEVREKVQFKKPLLNINNNGYLERNEKYVAKDRNLSIDLHCNFDEYIITYRYI